MCIPKSNHRNLVDTCYPAAKALPNIGPEYRPNSNELSRLAYYTSNKPAKLLKVGQYLDGKVSGFAKGVNGSGKGSEGAKG
jgi:protein EFR3